MAKGKDTGSDSRRQVSASALRIQAANRAGMKWESSFPGDEGSDALEEEYFKHVNALTPEEAETHEDHMGAWRTERFS